MAGASVILDDVRFRYEDMDMAFNLAVAAGELTALIGPSGAGKTTILNLIAGFERPRSGIISIDGRDIGALPVASRPVTMVFQEHNLFAHLDVAANVGLGISPALRLTAEDRMRAAAALARVGLEGFERRLPGQLSGGERQRVALARALAYDPEILFFDEPLSAIDYKLRKTLEKELKDIHRETGKTFVYITHSLEEAMVMSDRIGVMRSGKLVQVGTPNEIYTAPNSKFVSEFIGDVNVLPVTLEESGKLASASLRTEFSAARIPAGFRAGHLVVRPEFLRFLERASDAENVLVGRLYNEYALGSRIQYQVRVGEQVFLVEKLRQQAYGGERDDEVMIGWDGRDSIVVGP
jgi:spermidine/putrescine transport system ATP-binding protein